MVIIGRNINGLWLNLMALGSDPFKYTNLQTEILMKFEWDETKNKKNIEKHGIDFNDAITIFDDDEKIEAIDTSA